jgi:hypothetical protein
MPRTCTVCRLPSEIRQKANQALLDGEGYRTIAKRFDTSTAALVRHKKSGHADELRQKAVKVQEARELASAESLVDKLERYEREALRLAKKAEKAGDLRTAAAILTTGVTRFAELVARLRGELQQATTQINILALSREMRVFLEDPGARHLLETARQIYSMPPELLQTRLQRLLAKARGES